MYQDNESIKQFERQHARDKLAELAHDLADGADTDLVTGHLAAERRGDKLSVARAIVRAAAVIGLLLYFAYTFNLNRWILPV
jgi:hypothetical protein